MPRHRRERVPRHRAQRLAGHPARRVRVTPAVPAPRTALDDTGLFDTGPDDTGPDDTGPERAGLVGPGVIGTVFAGTGLAGTVFAGTGLAGTGLAGTGLDDTETAPLAALTWTLPRSFENEVARLADLAVTAAKNGAVNIGAADNGAADNGAADNGAADHGAADHGAADHGAPRNGLPDRAAAAGRPPDYRPPSHSHRRSRQTAGEVSSRPAGTQRGVVRGLLVTPWFAAASGFVIAVSLWIYSPHPQLAFPDNATGTSEVPCTPDGCSQHFDRQSAGSLTIKSGQQFAPQHQSAKPAKTQTRGQTRTAASGLAFGYIVQPAADGNFWLIVTVTGKHPIKDWRLGFVLPGAHIQTVYGADWQEADSHGGTARPFTGDPSQQHGAPGDWGGQGGPHDQPGVFFTVLASGKPVAPTRCTFDGASCTFHKLSSPSQGERG